MADYRITKVSNQEPRTYDGPNGTVYYIKVLLDGHDKPVSIGKRSPDALKEGDVVTGEITATQYETDKFTAQKPFTAGGTKAFTADPNKQAEIKAEWAIGQAMQWAIKSDKLVADEIEANAKMLYAMVDRVKDSNGLKVDGGLREPSGLEKARAQAEAIKAKTSDVPEVPKDDAEFKSLVAAGLGDYDQDPIDLSEIPF